MDKGEIYFLIIIVRGMNAGARTTMLLSSCVTLDKLLSQSELPFPHV